jgi:hypothetical protein
MPLPPPRVGAELKVLHRKVDYSFWPMVRTTRRFGLQSRVFATDPWSVIRHSIDQRCAAASKAQAQAFRAQSQDYFRAAEVAGLFTAKPVLLYYSFLNLVKAFVLTKGQRIEYSAAFHGLKERIHAQNGRELLDSVLEAVPSGPNVNIFDDFLSALRGTGLGGQVTYRVPAILPQILQGHRLWCAASHENERFIEVARIDLVQDVAARTLWIVLNIFEDDLTRLGVAHAQMLRGAGLHGRFREVASAEMVGQRRLLKFEQVTPVAYTHRPSDKVPELVGAIKNDLWSNVLSVPPYRKYYVYVAPLADRAYVLPQLASIFGLFYYLGSVTRYKPQKIAGLLQGGYGAQLEECVLNLPNQFLYLLASELARQEVARAAIV